MRIDDINNLRIVKNVYIPFRVTNDVIDELVRRNTITPNENHVHEESYNIRIAFVESSTPSYDVKCSLSIPKRKRLSTR